MAIDTREKEINGAYYTVTQLPARRALRLKAKLIKIFGPVMAQFFLTISDKEATEQSQKDNIVRSVEMLASNISESDLEHLVVEMLQGVRRNGSELTPSEIDMQFAGDMASLYQVLWFVAEVNFGNFFALMGIGNAFERPLQSNPAVTKKTFTRKS